jgi:NAD(P)-dependent dehydrogenase (short-subunit alcohol dehydrogenase family)
MALESFGTDLNTAVIGASGGIGGALAEALENCPSVSTVHRLSRSNPHSSNRNGAWRHLDIENEDSVADTAASIRDSVGSLHLVIVASGILHDGTQLQPEKSLQALTDTAMETAFRVNTIGPALVAKHFLPLLAKNRKTVFAALSARVGSIEDNRLGGWHAYRASKAALNMMIKTMSIELARRHDQALCVALHPGTVDSALSKPFQSGVPEGKLFAPGQSARALLAVLNGLTSADSGGLYAWDGSRIPF